MRAKATVCGVKRFENLTAKQIGQLEEEYNHLICGDKEYWEGRRGCHFGVLVWLRDVRRIESVWIAKRDWRAWVVLTEREDFGLLKRC